MVDYILVGGGAFARELHDWFTPSLTEAGSRFLGYLDDGDEPMRAYGHALPQLGHIADYRPDPAHRLVMAIGSPAGKQKIVDQLGAEHFSTLIHPTAWVSRSARIGRGAIIAVFADISANAIVGDFTTVNGYSSLGHDAELGAFATLSGYVDLTGGTKVGMSSFLGSGSRVLPHVSLGERCTVGAGAVVVRSTGDDVTLYVPPARRL
ncbi:acetyltransferase [Gluconacetobacter azotocaptans]|uniref:acetyltransferase n=1 Tax=Gluconacetobacter azotocaptans TaxID=142834 RepID=UPI00195C50D1|nr:acetyltransferase [Gluconacetobacter azotocaptans]MBM9403565.1 acetyltransferase [Gluconacetobacter azotocaptans]